MNHIDPIELSLFLSRAAFVAEEMGVVLERAAFSPNIKDRRDFSCAMFDTLGRLVGQASHIPVHLGAMPELMSQLLNRFSWRPGDIVWSNDPTVGGTHLPDISLVQAVFLGTERVGFVMCRAHHSDVGGISPGSMPLSTELAQEGVCIPPQLLVSGGKLLNEHLSLFLRNVRTPAERQGDIAAQVAACSTGAARFAGMAKEFGLARLPRLVDAAIRASQRRIEALLGNAKSGRYSAADTLELPEDEVISLNLSVTIGNHTAIIDFTEMPPWIPICLNAPRAVCKSAAYYVFWSLAQAADSSAGVSCVRITEGSFAPIHFRFKAGTLCDPPPTAPVAAGNVETSQRLVDLLLQALQPAFPSLIPACGQGTMNNVALGGIHPRNGSPFAYYETIAGGVGAHPDAPGGSGMHSHMSNTRNSSIEELESYIPVRILRYEIARGTGGNGEHRGGDGLIREFQALAEIEFSLLSQRRKTGPPGAANGQAGSAGQNWYSGCNHAASLPGLCAGRLQIGESLRIQTPGGGGWGPAQK